MLLPSHEKTLIHNWASDSPAMLASVPGGCPVALSGTNPTTRARPKSIPNLNPVFNQSLHGNHNTFITLVLWPNLVCLNISEKLRHYFQSEYI